jgi:hypothetical protein
VSYDESSGADVGVPPGSTPAISGWDVKVWCFCEKKQNKQTKKERFFTNFFASCRPFDFHTIIALISCTSVLNVGRIAPTLIAMVLRIKRRQHSNNVAAWMLCVSNFCACFFLKKNKFLSVECRHSSRISYYCARSRFSEHRWRTRWNGRCRARLSDDLHQRLVVLQTLWSRHHSDVCLQLATCRCNTGVAECRRSQLLGRRSAAASRVVDQRL